MRRSFLFISILIFISGITWALNAQQKPPEKKYTVALPLQQWIQVTNELEYIKNQLRQSDLPSKQVAFMSDSLLTPLQSTIGQQVNMQMAAEKPQVKPDSTTKPKK